MEPSPQNTAPSTSNTPSPNPNAAHRFSIKGSLTSTPNPSLSRSKEASESKAQKHSRNTSKDTLVLDTDSSSTADFVDDVATSKEFFEIPTLATLKKVENFPILGADGKSIPFKYLYTGPNVARRVMVIFVRHFFCGVRSSTTHLFTSLTLAHLPPHFSGCFPPTPMPSSPGC